MRATQKVLPAPRLAGVHIYTPTFLSRNGIQSLVLSEALARCLPCLSLRVSDGKVVFVSASASGLLGFTGPLSDGSGGPVDVLRGGQTFRAMGVTPRLASFSVLRSQIVKRARTIMQTGPWYRQTQRKLMPKAGREGNNQKVEPSWFISTP